MTKKALGQAVRMGNRDEYVIRGMKYYYMQSDQGAAANNRLLKNCLLSFRIPRPRKEISSFIDKRDFSSRNTSIVAGSSSRTDIMNGWCDKQECFSYRHK